MVLGYKVVPDGISHDAVEAALQILEGAHSGEIVGLAFVVMLRGRKFFTNVAGACRSDPHLTRGFVCALDDELKHIIGEEREQQDTGTGPP